MRKLKIILFLILSGILFSSCGPRRLGCGPNRCFIETEKESSKKYFAKTFYSDIVLS